MFTVDADAIQPVPLDSFSFMLPAFLLLLSLPLPAAAWNDIYVAFGCGWEAGERAEGEDCWQDDSD